jgi:hypothetical protein
MTLLQVTNGDYAAEAIGRLGLGGEVLAWRDVLHEGPVEDRARFLAEEGWGDRARIDADLRARDAALLRAAPADIVFWFESDLYDQLQLMQAVARVGTSAADAALAQFDLRPDGSFAGLSQLSAAELRALYEGRRGLGEEAAGFLGRAWDAFCSPEPLVLEQLAVGPTPLPLVAAALHRHLEQFPAVGSGLSRTERALLEGAIGEPLDAAGLFHAQHRQEERPFMGDAWVWRIADRLQQAGLLAGVPEGRATTATGRRALAGEIDRMQLPAAERSAGGVRFSGPRCWRWDPSAGRLRAPRS